MGNNNKLLLSLAALSSVFVRPAFARPANGAFNPSGAVVALRVGDGVVPLDGTTAATFLDYFDLATGALVQSIPLSVNDRAMTCSVVGGGSYQIGGITRSVDTHLLVVPCYNVPVGTTTTIDTHRNALTISGSGEKTDVEYHYNSITNIALATIDGSYFWGSTM